MWAMLLCGEAERRDCWSGAVLWSVETGNVMLKWNAVLKMQAIETGREAILTACISAASNDVLVS